MTRIFLRMSVSLWLDKRAWRGLLAGLSRHLTDVLRQPLGDALHGFLELRRVNRLGQIGGATGDDTSHLVHR